MSFVAVAVVGAGVVGAVASSNAASDAADSQAASAQQGIDTQQQQFNTIVELLSPYVDAGDRAIYEQMGLLGLNGDKAQQNAINQLEQSPQFQSLMQQGENAILQNASATGGLRGGNTQAALAQYRPQILSQLIESQFGKLGSISGLGQAAAAGQAAAGQNSANNIANLLQQQGAAQAGASLAQGQAWSNVANTIPSAVGYMVGGGF